MKGHYCVKCGEELMLKHKFCPKCKTPVKEVPLTKKEQETKERIMELQANHKQNPLIGLAIVLGFLFIGFGIPFIIMKTGIGTSTFSQGLFLNIVFILINFGLYKYRKSMKYEPKKYYNLTIKDTNYEFEKTCRNCGGKLTNEMIYCPRCNTSVSEDGITGLQSKDTTLKEQSEILENNQQEKQVLYREINDYDDQVQQKPKYRFCSKCGSELTVEGNFCGNCGSRINGRDD